MTTIMDMLRLEAEDSGADLVDETQQALDDDVGHDDEPVHERLLPL
jgi:hypothetical protein